VETEGESTVHSTTLAGEIMRPHGPPIPVIVVSDGYHIYRVKRMLQSRGLKAYGSPRKGEQPGTAARPMELTSSRRWDICCGGWGWGCEAGVAGQSRLRACHENNCANRSLRRAAGHRTRTRP